MTAHSPHPNPHPPTPSPLHGEGEQDIPTPTPSPLHGEGEQDIPTPTPSPQPLHGEGEQAAARAVIAGLVARYDAIPKATRDGYNEDQLRHAFILPLFRALGWNTDDPFEMTAEERVSKGFVDFGFYLGSIPAFYLETKRVSAGVTKPEFMAQAINYAYLKGVTWAILSDFEDLIAFNAEYRYEHDSASRPPMALDLHYTSYATDGFDDLWLLSKAAMRQRPRPLDVRAERGGIKVRRRPVTELLFEDLTRWRSDIFDGMRKWSPPLFTSSPATVDNAVQKLLDRLIFIRTAEDRGIEPPILQGIHRQNPRAMWWPKLLATFRDLDGVYNSNLFAASELDQMDIHDADLIKRIIDGLYTRPNIGGAIAYDFAAISADVLGRVYEQYLGFRTLEPASRTPAAKSAASGKQQRRQQQGIYYTPEYIVRYLVGQTLGKLLEPGADGTPGRDPLSLRVVDPACGSGSFLIAAFDALDAAMLRRQPDAGEDARRAWRRTILTECVCGVDLDEQAVEVTRLNLLLRAAQGRGKLPLLTNIRQGNSLVEDSAVDAHAFTWERAFPSVMGESGRGGFDAVLGNPPYVRGERLSAVFKDYAAGVYETAAGSADLYVYFIERGVKLLNPSGVYGVIVANKWLRAGYGKKLRAWLKPRLRELVDFGDLQVFQDATTYPCIVIAAPNSSDEPALGAQVDSLDFDDLAVYLKDRRYPVARAALTAGGWSLAGVSDEAVLAKVKAAGVPLKDYLTDGIYYGVKTGYNAAFVISEATRAALVKQDANSADLIKPFLIGRDVKRYAGVTPKQYLIFTGRGLDLSHYPAIEEHLTRFRDRLTPRPPAHVGRWSGRKAGTYQWYETQDPVNYHALFEQPKLVYPSIIKRLEVTFDTAGSYVNDKCFVIPGDDKYLLGILNSTLGHLIASQTLPQLRGGFFEARYVFMKDFPIRRLDLTDPAQQAQHAALVARVERMLALKQRHAEQTALFHDDRHTLEADIAALDAEIDQQVYALYGLTEAEIARVE